jgi:hypothetical protein
MGHTKPQSSLWPLIRAQHGVVTRAQLLDHGLSPTAIGHRLRNGRLHPLWRGVYAVGRPEVSRHGVWMAAVLGCGPDAALSHRSAGALWQFCSESGAAIDVSVPADRRRPGILVHRRTALKETDLTRRHNIPVTTPICTIIDLAASRSRDEVEQAIGEADKRGLTDPEALRNALDEIEPRPGVATLRQILDRRTFVLTDSNLERRFLPIAREAGLPLPLTRRYTNSFRVDFRWPDLGLVVETDGLRYHRTPAQQTTDRVRDQMHTAAGLTCLRFTHEQIAFERAHVLAILTAVATRLTTSPALYSAAL